MGGETNIEWDEADFGSSQEPEHPNLKKQGGGHQIRMAWEIKFEWEKVDFGSSHKTEHSNLIDAGRRN